MSYLSEDIKINPNKKIKDFAKAKASTLNSFEREYIIFTHAKTSPEEIIEEVIYSIINNKTYIKYRDEFIDDALKDVEQYTPIEIIKGFSDFVLQLHIQHPKFEGKNYSDFLAILKENRDEKNKETQDKKNAKRLKQIHDELMELYKKHDKKSEDRKNKLFTEWDNL